MTLFNEWFIVIPNYQFTPPVPMYGEKHEYPKIHDDQSAENNYL
jgi:hypothetical protein